MEWVEEIPFFKCLQEFGLNFCPIKRISCYNQVTLAKALLAILKLWVLSDARTLLLPSARCTGNRN